MIQKNSLKQENTYVNTPVVLTYLKNTFHSILTKDTYANILYLISDKGYTYGNEIRKVTHCNPIHYLSYLKNNKIIERFNLSEDKLNMIRIANDLPRKTTRKIVTYRLTSNARDILQNPIFYDLMITNITDDVKEYIQDINEVYQENLEKNKRQWELKVKRAQEKSPRYRTAEDLAILEMIR